MLVAMLLVRFLNAILANAMENCKLRDAGFDEYHLFSLPSLKEEICFDDTMPPIYDVYNDESDIFSPPTIEEKVYDDYDDGYDSFTPTVTNNQYFDYVESNNTFMHVDHEKNALCDNYIIKFAHDANESYYERGKHDLKYLNTIKFPLFMLKFLKLHLLCLAMLVILCFIDLFSYNILMYRKWVRLKCI